MLYRRKSNPINAEYWDGTNEAFQKLQLLLANEPSSPFWGDGDLVTIHAKSGFMMIPKGTYVIYTKDGLLLLEKDIFEASYEPVS
jgi:hypothetical protein